MDMMKKSVGNSIKDFKVISEIGHGGFATVYEAYCEKSQRHVAIKKISKKLIRERKIQNRVQSEIQIHSSLNHRTVVQCYNSFEDRDYIYLVLELCGNGNLEDYLKEKGPLHEDEAHDIIVQVINGVRFLKSRNVLHRDISLRNVLLTDQKDIKLADFGLSDKLSHPNEKKYTILGTPNFMSPEVVTGIGQGFETSCWSVGVILYALLVGELPFEDPTLTRTLNKVVMEDVRLPSSLSEEAKEFLLSMLQKDPHKRAHIDELHNFSFFKKYQGKYWQSKKFESYRSIDSGTGSIGSLTHSGTRFVHKPYETDRDSYLKEYRKKCMESQDAVAYHSLGSHRSTDNDSKYLKGSNYNLENSSKCHSKSREKHRDVFEKNAEVVMPARKNYQGLHHSSENDSNYHHGSRENHCKALDSHTEVTMATKKNYQYDTPHNFGRLKDKIDLLPSRNYDLPNSISSNSKKYTAENKKYQYNPEVANHHHKSLPKDIDLYLESLPSLQCSAPPRICIENNAAPHRLSRQRHVEKKANMHRQRSSEDFHAFSRGKSTCSHDHLCCITETTSCSHVTSCTCRKETPNSRNIFSWTGTVQNENNVEEKCSPLNTLRIKPTMKVTKKCRASINSSGQVCLEFFSKKKRQTSKKEREYISDVFIVSSDGMRVTFFKPKSKCLLGDEPPPIPEDRNAIQHYSHENLPDNNNNLWLKYSRAKRFVDIMRSQTTKVTFYEDNGRCVIRENSDFLMEFYQGECISNVSDKITIVDRYNKKHDASRIEILNEDLQNLLTEFKSMQKKCKDVEKMLEQVCKASNSDPAKFFPVKIGQMTEGHQKFGKYLSSVNSNKENILPFFPSDSSNRHKAR